MVDGAGTPKTLGDNLSSYRNLDFFTGQSPEELKGQLDQIRLPFKIIAIYGSGGAHVAWVNLTKPVKKKKVSTKNKKGFK